MKKYIHIPIALLLIAIGIWGCTVTRTRTLASCLPEGPWASVSCQEQNLSIGPDRLHKLMADTVVTHIPEFQDFGDGILTLLIRTDGAAYLVEMGDNGNIALSDCRQPEKTRTFWHDAEASLYTRLTEGSSPLAPDSAA